MRRLSAVILSSLGFALAGCERPTLGAARADIDWSLSAEKPACVRVTATDAADANHVEAREIPLSGQNGHLQIALGQPAGWSATLEVVASLHLGTCAAPANVSGTGTAVFKLNRFQTLPFTLVESAGGSDAGSDGGAGDGGSDAGTADGGLDAGFDAGVLTCDGGIFLTSDAGSSWRDLTVGTTDIFVVGGGGALAAVSRTTVTDWAGGSCGTGDFNGVFRRPSNGKLYAASTSDGLVRVDGPQSCAHVTSLVTGSIPRALTGFEEGGDLVLFLASAVSGDLPVISRITVGASVTVQDRPVAASGDDVRDVAGPDEANLFAVGWESSGDKGFIYKLNAGVWTLNRTLSGGTRLYAVDVASPTSVFAAGDVFWEYDGSTWRGRTSPGFLVRGLRALSSTDVWAVGDANGRLSVARWDGTQWSYPTTFSTTNPLARIRGPSACPLWAVGTNTIVTTAH